MLFVCLRGAYRCLQAGGEQLSWIPDSRIRCLLLSSPWWPRRLRVVANLARRRLRCLSCPETVRLAQSSHPVKKLCASRCGFCELEGGGGGGGAWPQLGTHDGPDVGGPFDRLVHSMGGSQYHLHCDIGPVDRPERSRTWQQLLSKLSVPLPACVTYLPFDWHSSITGKLGRMCGAHA